MDNLVGLAAQISRTPIAFLSLIDGNRHWLKSQLGIDRALAHRYLNFCARAIDRTPEEFAVGSNSNSEFDGATRPAKTASCSPICDRTPCKFLQGTARGHCPRRFHRRGICRASADCFLPLREILCRNPSRHLRWADAGSAIRHGLRGQRLDKRNDRSYRSFGSASCEFGGAALAISQSPETLARGRRYHLRQPANLGVSSWLEPTRACVPNRRHRAAREYTEQKSSRRSGKPANLNICGKLQPAPGAIPIPN